MGKIAALGAFLGLGTAVTAKNMYSAFIEGGNVCHTTIAPTPHQIALEQDANINGILETMASIGASIGALALIQGTFTVDFIKKLYGQLYAECTGFVEKKVSSFLAHFFAKGHGTAEIPEDFKQYITTDEEQELLTKGRTRKKPHRYNQYDEKFVKMLMGGSTVFTSSS